MASVSNRPHEIAVDFFYSLRCCCNILLLQWDKVSDWKIKIAIEKDDKCGESASICRIFAIDLHDGETCLSHPELIFTHKDLFQKNALKPFLKYETTQKLADKSEATTSHSNWPDSCCTITKSCDSSKCWELTLKTQMMFEAYTRFICLVTSYVSDMQNIFEPKLQMSLSTCSECVTEKLATNCSTAKCKALLNSYITALSTPEDFSRSMFVYNKTFSIEIPKCDKSFIGEYGMNLALSVLPADSSPKRRGIIYVNMFGPFGFPMFSERPIEDLLQIEDLACWKRFGITVICTSKQEPCTLRLCICKELSFCEDVNPVDLVFFLGVKMIKAPSSMSFKHRLRVLGSLERSIGDLLMSYQDALRHAFNDALQSVLPVSKSVKRTLVNDASVKNIVSSVFEIVACSTSDVFRETCFSLMNSATTHEFRDDLHAALCGFTRNKFEMRKRKRSTDQEEEENEWKLLE